MALDPLVLTDCVIKIDDTEYSGKNTKVALSFSAAAIDITAMGLGTKVSTGGLKEWGLALEFIADESTTGEFFDMVGTVVDIEIRATSAVRSVTNPSYCGKGLVTSYNPISGEVGAAHLVNLDISCAGDLSRLTVVTP